MIVDNFHERDSLFKLRSPVWVIHFSHFILELKMDSLLKGYVSQNMNARPNKDRKRANFFVFEKIQSLKTRPNIVEYCWLPGLTFHRYPSNNWNNLNYGFTNILPTMARCYGTILSGQECFQDKSQWITQEGTTNLLRTSWYREKNSIRKILNYKVLKKDLECTQNSRNARWPLQLGKHQTLLIWFLKY